MNRIFELFSKNMRSTVAFLVVLFGFGYIFTVRLVQAPPGARDDTTGVLAIVALVTGYYFGANKDKSDQEKAKIELDGTAGK